MKQYLTRKTNRLKNYNYSAPGMYFLTVCVKDRKPVLGKIVGCGDFDAPRMVLSDYGKILDETVLFMNHKYEHIKIIKYVIMPNHFHMILRVENFGASETAAPYNNEVSKFISLLKRYCNRRYKENIWQKSFYDHIIQNESEFQTVWEYIDTNVIRWTADMFFTTN